MATQKLILVLKLLYHSSYRNFGSGQQCCYNSSGDIIVGPPGGGTADLVAPTGLITLIKHILVDVVPYFLCCKGRFRDCSRYYDKRQSDDCSDYPERPPPGMHKNHTCLLKKDSTVFHSNKTQDPIYHKKFNSENLWMDPTLHKLPLINFGLIQWQSFIMLNWKIKTYGQGVMGIK